MGKIITIVGRHCCGKTTLIENILPFLKKKGYRIVTIKHGTHKFEIDKKGKDTWRHMESGAEAVLMVSSSKVALIENVTHELSLNDLTSLYIEPYDLIIAEGFKNEQKPKIEVARKELSEELVTENDPHLLAVVTDIEKDLSVPMFQLNDYEAIAGFIEDKIILRKE